MFHRAVEHAQAAYAKVPQSFSFGCNLGIYHSNVGSALKALGQSEEALHSYQQSVDVLKRVARDHPAVPAVARYLYQSYTRMVSLQHSRNRPAEAIRYSKLAREIFESLPKEGPEDLYNLACLRSMCSFVDGADRSEPSSQERAQARLDADQAFEALRRAIASGWNDLTRIKTDRSLDPLRARDDFKALVALLEARPNPAAAARRNESLPEARWANRDALVLTETMAHVDAKNSRLRAEQAGSYHAIGVLQNELHQWDNAVRSFDQALAIVEPLVCEEPENDQY
jgi:tetratricopeptide (TPR) repeat protein